MKGRKRAKKKQQRQVNKAVMKEERLYQVKIDSEDRESIRMDRGTEDEDQVRRKTLKRTGQNRIHLL